MLGDLFLEDEDVLVLEQEEVAFQGVILPQRLLPDLGAVAHHILDDDAFELAGEMRLYLAHHQEGQGDDLAVAVNVPGHEREIALVLQRGVTVPHRFGELAEERVHVTDLGDVARLLGELDDVKVRGVGDEEVHRLPLERLQG